MFILLITEGLFCFLSLVLRGVKSYFSRYIVARKLPSDLFNNLDSAAGARSAFRHCPPGVSNSGLSHCIGL